MDALNVVDEKVREKVQELIVKGKVKISELKAKVLEILERLGVSTDLTYGDVDTIIEAIKEKLRQALLKAVDKILDTLNVAEGVVREKVKELITKGEVKIGELKQKVIELLEKLGISVGADEPLMKRDIDDIIEKIKEKLKQALMKAVDKIMDALNIADQKVREKVQELIVKGKVKISELKDKVLEILERLGVPLSDEAEFP